ncbi:MAG: T9SS type A sorting domain-containing protein [Bacteroidetes bacterium]|nr:T9SS type A sorting domain-containing protein [Bacteroidota bacterium]
MKKIVLVLICFPCLILAQSQRQTAYLAAPDCYVQSFIPLPGGGNLLSGYSQYGTDSTLINMVFLNDSDVITSKKIFNTATHFDFVSNVVPFNNGFLVGGKSSDPSFFHPQIIKTDASGNVSWAKYFNNTSYWQGQIIRILPHGSTYSMYTFAETPFNDFYRIEGDASGSTFTGQQFTPDTAMSFRVFDAEQMNNSPSHILCGHANFNSTATRAGMLMKTTPSGVQWCKHITAGGNFKNDIIDVAAGSDGNSYSLYVCENMPGNQYSTIVLKFDSLGNKVWAKQLSRTGGTLNGCSIIESASHDFYVATYDNLLVAYLNKIDASGNLVWTRKWTPSQSGGASALKLFKDASGNIVLAGLLNTDYFVARLDANAGGCGFANSTVISATNATTVITNITFTTTAFSPTTVNETPVYSALAIGEVMLCGGVGIEEEVQNQALVIYPNPVNNKLAINFGQNEIRSIEIYNSFGERAQTIQFPDSKTLQSAELNVQALSPGVYFITATGGEKIYRSKFIKQ